MLGLPGVCYALVRVCNPASCLQLAPFALPPAPAGGYVSAAGFAAYFGWMALCVALHLLLPGERRQGTQLPDGTRLTYKLNGARLRA
jgi:delta14-sterol reductase